MTPISCPRCQRTLDSRDACPSCGELVPRSSDTPRRRRTRLRAAAAWLLAALFVAGTGGWLWARHAREAARREAADLAETRPLPERLEARKEPAREARTLESLRLAPDSAPEAAPAPPPDEPVTPLEEAVYELPELVNREEVNELLDQVYPPELREAGVSGEVSVRLLVGRDGTVQPGTVAVQEATDPAFVRAALPVVDRMRFRPATIGGMPVSVWVSVPILFELEKNFDLPPGGPLPMVSALF